MTTGETPVSRQARSAASTCAASVVVSGRTVARGSSASLSRVSASRRPLARDVSAAGAPASLASLSPPPAATWRYGGDAEEMLRRCGGDAVEMQPAQVGLQPLALWVASVRRSCAGRPRAPPPAAAPDAEVTLVVLLGCVASAASPCIASSAYPTLVGAALPPPLPLSRPPALPALCGVPLPLAFESSRLLAAALRACRRAAGVQQVYSRWDQSAH